MHGVLLTPLTEASVSDGGLLHPSCFSVDDAGGLLVHR